MEILIIGVLLLVLGLGGSYAYDQYKAGTFAVPIKFLQAILNLEKRPKTSAPIRQKKSQEFPWEELGIRFEKPNLSPEEEVKSVEELIALIEKMKQNARR